MRTSEDFSLKIETYLQKIKGDEQGSFLLAKAESYRLNKGGISISRTEGEMICFFIRLLGCRKFVEIGTLTGYSALWILKGLDVAGQLWTFEKDMAHAAIAKSILAEAIRLPQHSTLKYQLIEGEAEKNLESIEDEGPFDGIFIDGNKSSYGFYLDWANKNLKRGGLVICDNVFLGGGVLGVQSEQAGKYSPKQISVVDQVNRTLLSTDQFTGVLIPTSEGLAVAIKR